MARCRINGDDVLVEVAADARSRVSRAVLDEIFEVMRGEAPGLRSIMLDEAPYAPGRAFVALSRPGIG